MAAGTFTDDMTSIAIGFIGLGEAGFNIAGGLREAGVARLFAYDINTHTPGLGERIQRRARESKTTLVDSPKELAAASTILLSTVTASEALEAAKAAAPFLIAEHFFADLNSVSPATKQSIGESIASTGARFVEGAVMGPVPPYRHQVPILLAGSPAAELIDLLSPFGMKLEALEGAIGSASAVKMCRSIVVKGLEALILECVLGASRYGAEERVFASLKESFPTLDWNEMATYMMGRVVVHGERRAREMEEVADTLRAAGIDPIMAEATALRQDWCARLGLREYFGGEAPMSY
jgi:3-hydroxyisobutyrate dehydrogenase